MLFMYVVYIFLIKMKKNVLYVFYLQNNVFNIYGLSQYVQAPNGAYR